MQVSPWGLRYCVSVFSTRTLLSMISHISVCSREILIPDLRSFFIWANIKELGGTGVGFREGKFRKSTLFSQYLYQMVLRARSRTEVSIFQGDEFCLKLQRDFCQSIKTTGLAAATCIFCYGRYYAFILWLIFPICFPSPLLLFSLPQHLCNTSCVLSMMIVIKNEGKNRSTLFKNSHSIGGYRLTDNYNIVWRM